MENNENTTPQSNYDETLFLTSGIKFTHREIDVMSCISHMRGSSKIACLLSISTRTVETHTANIMRKIDANSREGIIDFLEKNGHLSHFKKHYLRLLIHVEFRKKLEDIRAIIKNKAVTCILLFDHLHQKNKAFVDTLQKDLAIAGVKYTHSTLKNLSPELLATLPSKEHVVIVISSPETESRKGKIQSHLNFSQDSQTQQSISYIGKSLDPTKFPNIGENNLINFETDDQYYTPFFELLKRILGNLDIEEQINSFNDHCHRTLEEFENEQTVRTSFTTSGSKDNFTSKSSIGKIVSLCVACVASCFVGYFFLTQDKGPDLLKLGSQRQQQIRSDFIVPSNNILLARSNLMSKIDEGLKGEKGIQVVAIFGIGGAGKSTTARKYASQQNASVVWEINAATRESIMDSFERLAYALCQSDEERNSLYGLQDIKNNVERDEKIILFVKAKLKSKSNWFLIYDNVEKFTSIRKYFPLDPSVWGNGKIIITTSNSNTKNNTLINHHIPVGELSAHEKFQLFISIMNKDNSNALTSSQVAEIKSFLNEIPPFPLDVSIAAYYLKSTGIPYQKYLERLKGDNVDFESIQTDVVSEASGYTKTRYNIITLSLKNLIETHKDFQDLLLMTSLLDYQKIPNILISSFKGETVVDNYIYSLKTYSLITSESSENSISSFSLHKSTQQIILAYLQKTLALQKNDTLIHSIGNSLEKTIIEAIDHEDFSKMKALASHGEVFLNHQGLLSEPMRSSIGGALGCIYYFLWDKNKAKYLLESNLENLNQHYDQSQDKIARLLVYLGNFYRSVGDYEKAKQLLTQSLVIYKKNPTYQGNAKAFGYLGVIYRDLGDYNAAKELLEKSLEIHGKKSQSDIGYAWILAQLGNIYMIYGNYPKAEQFLESSLAIYKMQSEDYVGVSWVLGRLGTLYQLIGEPEKALTAIKQSLLITRKYFADDHIFVGNRLAALGNVYAHNGDLKEAKELLTEGLNVFKKDYGMNHIETGHVQRMLGEAYLLEGDLETAEDLFNKSLLVFQQKRYPESYQALENLADLYVKKTSQAKLEGDPGQAKFFHSRALNYMNQSLETLNAFFEKDSPHIQKAQEKLSALLEQGA